MFFDNNIKLHSNWVDINTVYTRKENIQHIEFEYTTISCFFDEKRYNTSFYWKSDSDLETELKERDIPNKITSLEMTSHIIFYLTDDNTKSIYLVKNIKSDSMTLKSLEKHLSNEFERVNKEIMRFIDIIDKKQII